MRFSWLADRARFARSWEALVAFGCISADEEDLSTDVPAFLCRLFLSLFFNHKQRTHSCQLSRR